MKIEIFSSLDMAKCQNQVNLFLNQCHKNKHEIQDIKYTTSPAGNNEDILYSAMVIIKNAVFEPSQTKQEEL